MGTYVGQADWGTVHGRSAEETRGKRLLREELRGVRNTRAGAAGGSNGPRAAGSCDGILQRERKKRRRAELETETERRRKDEKTRRK